MKKLKRLLAVLMTFSMTMSVISMPVFAQDGAETNATKKIVSFETTDSVYGGITVSYGTTQKDVVKKLPGTVLATLGAEEEPAPNPSTEENALLEDDEQNVINNNENDPVDENLNKDNNNVEDNLNEENNNIEEDLNKDNSNAEENLNEENNDVDENLNEQNDNSEAPKVEIKNAATDGTEAAGNELDNGAAPVSDEPATASLSVGWTSEDYNGSVAGTYTFTAVLKNSEYELIDGVDMPTIDVTVESLENETDIAETIINALKADYNNVTDNSEPTVGKYFREDPKRTVLNSYGVNWGAPITERIKADNSITVNFIWQIVKNGTDVTFYISFANGETGKANVIFSELNSDAYNTTTGSVAKMTDESTSETIIKLVIPGVTEDVAYIKETGKCFVTLQEALNAAEVGETVVLLQDVKENVAIDKSMTLDLNQLRITPADNSIRIITISGEAENVTIENGTIANGGEVGNRDSGAVAVKNKAALTLIECDFLNNEGTDGIAVLTSGSLTARDCLFKENKNSYEKMAGYGYTVGLCGGDSINSSSNIAKAEFTNCDFIDNSSAAKSGAGSLGILYLRGVADVDVTGSAFKGNFTAGSPDDAAGSETPSGAAGAVYIECCKDVNITNTDFSGNESAGASGGGAVYAQLNGEITFKGCDFTDNKATTGGAVRAYAMDALNVIKCDFINNKATSGNGGAIMCENADNFVVKESIFTGNSASSMGGAILQYASVSATEGTLQNCDFSGNSAGYGGAVAVAGSVTSTMLADSNTTLEENVATYYGGAVYAQGGTFTNYGDITANKATRYGGGMAAYGGTVYNFGTVDKNTAGWYGGGIYGYQSNITVTNGTVDSNTAAMNGGAVYSQQSNVTVSGNSSITGNAAVGVVNDDETVSYGEGGGICNYWGTVTVGAGVPLCNNTAGVKGDDVYNTTYSETYPGVLNLAAAADMNSILNLTSKAITGWYVDGFNGETADRWSTTKATEYAISNGDITTVALKAAHEQLPDLTYTVVANYYVNGSLVNAAPVQLAVNTAQAGTTVNVELDSAWARYGSYNYTYTSGNDTLVVTEDGDNIIALRYDRTSSAPSIPSRPDHNPDPASDPTDPVEPTDIPETEVPLAEAPVTDIPETETPVVDIPEEEVPLSDVPKTGDISMLWIVLGALSGFGIMGISFAERRKRKNEN